MKAAIIAVLVVVLISPARTGTNLLVNPGFERPDGGMSGKQAGVAKAWETICGGSHPEIYSLDCKVKHSGKTSQRMTCAGYNYRAEDGKGICFSIQNGLEIKHPCPVELGLQAISQTAKVKAGRTYSCGVWVKIDGLTDAWEWFRLGIYWLDGKGKFLGEVRQDRETSLSDYGTHDWKKISLTAAAPANAASAKVYLHHHFVHGTVWYDDAWLKER